MKTYCSCRNREGEGGAVEGQEEGQGGRGRGEGQGELTRYLPEIHKFHVLQLQWCTYKDGAATA